MRRLVATLAAGALALAGTADAETVKRRERIFVPGGIGLGVYLDPASHLFGDPVTARAEVLIDPIEVDPASVRLRTSFAPYRFRAPVSVTRRVERGVIRILHSYELMCLRRPCRPRPGTARTFRFPDATLTFTRRNGRDGDISVRWYPLTVASRLSADTALRADLQARAQPFPSVAYRFEPTGLSAKLFGASALLALIGLAVIGRTAGPAISSRVRARRLARALPVQRELALLRDAARRGDTAALRRALDGVAITLSGNSSDDLVWDARRLAWSEANPPTDDVLALADRVEARLSGAR